MDEAEVIGADEAAALLDVPTEQVLTMVEEGLLTPVSADGEAARFTRADVEAVRLVGG